MAVLLKEDGDRLLLETGGRILLSGQPETWTLVVNGVDRSEAFDLSSLNIVDQINEQPNTLSLEVFSFTPAIDQSIEVGFIYEPDGGKTLFAGTITSVRRLRWRADQGRIVYAIQAVDATRTLDALLVTKSYGSQSATAIVTDLIDTYTSGITRANLESGLASVETEFKMARVSDALTQVANLVGAFWYLDDDSDLHFFVTAETVDIPADIDSSNTDIRRDVTYEQDVSQVRNRIYVEGQGSASLVGVASGTAQIPVDDATVFDADGGSVVTPTHETLTYTGVAIGGSAGRLQSTASSPGSAPSLAEGSAGVLGGTYYYKVSFANAAGETTPGTSASVSPSAFASPSAPGVGVSSTVWGGLVVGTNNYKWKVTFVTALGETLGGTASATASGTTINPSSAQWVVVNNHLTTGSMALGTYYYKYTFSTPSGETLIAPTASSAVTLTGSQNAVEFAASGLPDPPSGAVFKLYRTVVGGTSTGPYYFVATVDASAAYTDRAADAQLGGEPPNFDTAGAYAMNLSNIPTGPTGVLGRRVYRTKSGGSEYFFVGQISDNSTTTMTDTIPDTSLGISPPLATTAGGHAVSLTSIPTGGADITQRVIYRTKAGETTDFYYIGSIDNNTTTTFTDNLPDASLGRLALTEATIGALAGDSSLTLTTVSGFPTAGWARSGSALLRYTGISSTTLTGIPAKKSVTSITRSGSTATATITTHGYTTGWYVTVAGATQSEYNGTYEITVTSANTFTYAVSGTPATPATGTIEAYGPGALLTGLSAGAAVSAAPMPEFLCTAACLVSWSADP